MSSVSATSSSASSYSYTSISGLDTAALIEAAVAAKLAPADTMRAQVDKNDTRSAAYETMQTLLTAVQDAAQALRAPTGTSGQGDDVFRDRAAYLTAAGGESEAADLLDVTVDDGTDLGSYDIVIEQVATAAKEASDSQTSSDSALGYDGVFSLGLEDGDSAEITVTAEMTLTDLKEAINGRSGSTGVKASIIAVSGDQHVLVLTATDTGKAITTSASAGDDVLAGLGVTDGVGGFANELQAAQDAILTVDGLAVSRDSNDISDVLDGVTLHLYEAAPETTVTVEVDEDLSGIKEAVETFVEAYNAFRAFVTTNQETDSTGVAAEDAVLFGDSLLRAASTALQTRLTAGIGGVSLADFGITMTSDNQLDIDDEALNAALLEDADALQDFFAYSADTSSTDLRLLNRGEGLGDATFTLDITMTTDGTIASAAVDGDSSLFTVSGSRIKGAEGTIYEGYTFVWTGADSAAVTVEVSTGLAEGLYNEAARYADPLDGLLQQDIDALSDSTSDLSDRISALERRAETYQSMLESKYARMEAAVAKAQALLDTLDAIFGTDDD
jgi:flagellar hook-associated protein 2